MEASWGQCISKSRRPEFTCAFTYLLHASHKPNAATHLPLAPKRISMSSVIRLCDSIQTLHLALQNMCLFDAVMRHTHTHILVCPPYIYLVPSWTTSSALSLCIFSLRRVSVQSASDAFATDCVFAIFVCAPTHRKHISLLSFWMRNRRPHPPNVAVFALGTAHPTENCIRHLLVHMKTHQALQIIRRRRHHSYANTLWRAYIYRSVEYVALSTPTTRRAGFRRYARRYTWLIGGNGVCI